MNRCSPRSRCLLLALSLSIPALARGDAITDGYAHITGFSITITGSGSVVWTDDWFSDTYASAYHDVFSDSDFDEDLASALGADTSVSAATAHANSSAYTDFANRSLGSDGHASLFDPLSGTAEALSSSLLDNYFMLIDGSGTVEVEVKLDYELFLDGYADASGFFDQTAFGGLQISGLDIDDFFLSHSETSSGTNTSAGGLFNGSVTDTLTLTYGDEYYLKLTTDSEHSVVNVVPIPSAGAMIGIALGILLLKRGFDSRRQRQAR